MWLETESRKDFFSYDRVAKDLWREKLREAKDQRRIHFDDENDDRVSQREIVIPQKWWDFTKCKFRCEFRLAGGDWQSSVGYFRCQITGGYAKGPKTYDDPYFCVIPGKKDGNWHLDETKAGWCAPDADKKERPDEDKCWRFLKATLTKMVQDEIREVRSKDRHMDNEKAGCSS